jgi:hypothetical protein
MRHIPLLVIPFLLYNAFAFLFPENPDVREPSLFSVTLVSGGVFTLTVGATIVLVALALLAVEIVKATRVGSSSIVDHVLATALFVVFLLEFILIRQAATDTFFILMAIALVDLVCGFAVSIRSATRDVSVGV